MIFSDVSSGEAWQPESAARYNAVNLLLRTGNFTDVPENMPPDAVDVFNASPADIAAFAPVAVTGIYKGDSPLQQNARFSGRAVLCGKVAVDDSLPWGIALQDIPAGAYGTVRLYGTAPAFFTGTGRFVTPGVDGLTAGESGNALAVFAPDGPSPGLIVLGGASGKSAGTVTDEYRGYFKLQKYGSDSVQICNGLNPALPDCGTTDVPGVTAIPQTILVLPETLPVDLFLVFFYDSASCKYSASFRFDVPDDAVFYRLIGRVESYGVIQSYRSSESRMSFGNEWYLV